MVISPGQTGIRPILLGFLFLILSACVNPPPRRPVQISAPMERLRSEIQKKLAAEAKPQKRCLLRMQEAAADLVEGKNAASIRQDCPDGYASILASAAALLAGDPWLAQEEALHFLESTTGNDAPHILWMRRLAAALLTDADVPADAFVRRLERIVLADPALPVLALVPELRGRIAPPGRSRELGTGQIFLVMNRKTVPGRFAFHTGAEISPFPDASKETWQDGQLLAANGPHPERITLETAFSCSQASPVLLEISPEGPAIVQTSDGFRADTSRFPGAENRAWRIILPGFAGKRILAIHLAGLHTPRRPRVRLLPSAPGCSLNIAPIPPERLVPPSPEPAELALLTQAAESTGIQSSRARRILETWPSRKPRPALVDFLHVRALLLDETLPAETALRRSRRILDALPQAGWVLREKASMDLDEGHPEQAMQKLSGIQSAWAIVERARIAPSIQTESNEIPGDLLSGAKHYRVFTTAAAAAFGADPALALSRLRTAAAMRPDRIDRMQGLLRLHLYADALAEGHRLLQVRQNPDTELAAAMAQACRGTGDLSCARHWAQVRLELEPSSEMAFLQWLDASHAADAQFPIQETLGRHVRLFPSHRDALLLFWPSLEKRAAPLPDRQQLLQTKFGLSAPAVFLLNREEHFLSPSGGGIVLVTRWVRLNTPTAVEELGELELPDDAVVAEVHTRKADGSVYPPSATPQKSSFSLRNLEPGDIVEFRYLRANPPISGMPSRTWVQRFFFAHRVFPTVLAQWILHAPAGVEPVILTDGEIPPVQQTLDNEGAHFSFSLWMREPLPREVRMTRFTPQSVRAHAGFGENDVSELLAGDTPSCEWDSLEMQELASRLCPHKEIACIARTARWVQTHIRMEETVQRPAHILDRRAGFRPHLLYTLLCHEGFEPHIALARPERTAMAGDEKWPDPRDYPVVLVHIPGFGFIDTRFSQLPPGDVVPALSGTKALILSGKRETAMMNAARPQTRELEIRVRLQADRGAAVSLREIARGFFAVQKIEQMEGLSREALHERIQTESLQKTFPGARVEDVRWRRITPDRDDLELQVRFLAPSVTVMAGSGMELRRVSLPWNLSRRYRVFSERQTDFMPDAMPRTRTEIVIEPPAGFRVESAPELETASRFGRIRRVLRVEGKNARLILEKQLAPDIVPAAAWKEFSDFCRSFDEIETMPVQLTPLPATP